VSLLVCQVIGEAAAPDEFDAKKYLLSLPQEYSGYRFSISTDPEAWLTDASSERCLLYAQKLAEMAKEQFLGMETVLSRGSSTFACRGKDANVMEWLDSWLMDNTYEAMAQVEDGLK
jgi:hypothetical protein